MGMALREVKFATLSPDQVDTKPDNVLGSQGWMPRVSDGTDSFLFSVEIREMFAMSAAYVFLGIAVVEAVFLWVDSQHRRAPGD